MKTLIIITLFVLMVLCVGCGPSPEAIATQTATAATAIVASWTATPTNTPTNTPTAVPTNTPTYTPTNAPTATSTNTPTATLVPLTPTSDAERIQGGVIIAKGTSQLIVYGQRTGTSEEGVHVVHAETFDEVETQKGIQMALSGSGPPLFVLLENQLFEDGKGGTNLVDMSIGVTEDPNVFIVTLWTGDIAKIFPSTEALSLQEELFSILSGPVAEQEGWLENGQIGLIDQNVKAEDQQESFDFILFRQNEDLYVLGFLPNYKYVLPPDDLRASGFTAQPGQDHMYLVRGFIGGTIWLPLQNGFSISIPIFQVNYIERQK